jgi:L-ascorbate metabolism protein UlaG (beta-lactamase superfamily)
VRITLDGAQLLTDPVLRTRLLHLRRVVPPARGEENGVDGVLISHAHWDHLDLPSLAKVGRRVPVVVPKGLGRYLRVRGFRKVIEVVAGDEVDLAGVSVRATPAAHDGSRWPYVRAAALGFALAGSSRVFFAGDTDLFPELDGLVPDLDLALLPIWGWGPKLGRGEHLDPERAAEALTLLRPRIAVPIHWGTLAPIYVGDTAFLREPPESFRRAAAVRAPDVDVRVLQPGESLTLTG